MTAELIIELATASAYRRSSYGITHESAHVYRVTGAGLHNRLHPHRVTVWDNTVRPNVNPARRSQHTATAPGAGAYVDPNGKGTDEAVSVTFGAESTVMTDNGTNTGTPGSGQVYAAGSVATGQTVRLRYPDGTLSDPYVVTPRPRADPILVPAS